MDAYPAAGERQSAALASARHPLQPILPLPPSLSPSSHVTFFRLSCLLCPQPPAPNQRKLRNRLLAQEQLLSERFLIACMEGELGTALAPVMQPSSVCPGWPNPPFTPLIPPVVLAIQNFSERTVSIFLSSR